MNPLQKNQRVLVWLCMLSTDKLATIWKKLAYIIFTSILCITSMNIAIWPSVFYLRKYLSIDLESCLYALFQILLGASMLYAYILFLPRKRLDIIFINLAKIYRKSKYCILIKISFSIQSPSTFRWKRRIISTFGANKRSMRIVMGHLLQMHVHQLYRRDLNGHSIDIELLEKG